MYTAVRGWISYRGEAQAQAIRSAIQSADDRSDDIDYASSIAQRWRFIDYEGDALASRFAFWAGTFRSGSLNVFRTQVEAVASVLKSDSRGVGAEHQVWVHQGAFDIEVEDGPLLEWRLFGSALHERDREEPLWEPVYLTGPVLPAV